jgi:hypothetical protein
LIDGVGEGFVKTKKGDLAAVQKKKKRKTERKEIK